MPRVAIIGSCITRDLWPIRGAAADRLLYVSRTSLPSLFAPPVAGFKPAAEPPRGLKRHQHRAIVADLRKTELARLVAFRPTHLIFDFIDERFDLLSVGDSLATLSWELEHSGYLKQTAFRGAREIPRLSAACERLWAEAAGEFAAFVRATPLKDAALILHVARWAERQRTPSGRLARVEGTQIRPGAAVDIGEHNALLAAYEARFAEVMPPLARVDPSGLRLADPRHAWGPSPFHYIPEYYAELWRQLAALGVDPPTERLAAPSAPAA